jgi:chromosome segregation ATPase
MYCVSYLYNVLIQIRNTLKYVGEKMARVGITFDQVSAAADALIGAGKQVTILAVREALGTGSPNTVHKHLVTWRSKQAPKQSTAYDMPADLVSAFGKELARGAAAAKAEVEAELVQAQIEAAELSSAGEVLETEADDLREQSIALTTERDQAQATAQERAQEIERQGQAIAREQHAAELARVELAKAQLKIEAGVERVDEMRKEIERIRAAFDTAQAGRTVAEQQAAVASSQFAGEQAKSADLAQRLEGAYKIAQEAAQAVEKANREANTARIAEQASQARLESAARELESASRQVEQLRETLKETRASAKEAASLAAAALQKAEASAVVTGSK